MNLEEYNKRKSQALEEYKNAKTSKKTNNNQKVTLSTTDGKEFGTISSNAYRAITNGTLEYYKPVDKKEKSVLDKYKEHIKSITDVGTSDNKDNSSNLTKEQQAYIKYAVNKETEIKGVNNNQKLLGGDNAKFVAAPEKSGWDKFVEGAKDILLPKGSNAKKIYDEATGFKEDDTGWTDDQIAQLAINALHRADSGDTADFAIVDRAYARLSRSSKYKDSDLVLALKEAQKSWGASPWKAAGLNVKAAVAGMSSDISSFANSLGADNVPILKDITESSIAYGKKAKQDAAEYNKGSYGEYLGALTQGVVNLAPYVILGSGKTAQTALTKGPQYLTYIKTVANNPSFWYSLTTMWGNKYQEALDGGATETDALKNAALYAIPAALIEVGSGLGSEAMAGEKLSQTIIGEIGEEIAQDLISGISDKVTTKPNLPLFSVKEDAVVNPVDLLKTAVTTAPIVAIAGGANMAINKVANQYNQKKELKKLVSDPKVVDAIVSFTDNTYKRATQGISTQNATTVNSGDTFIDTKSNNIIKVAERNENTSTVELTTADGKKEVKTLPNKTVDSLISDLRYTKVNTSVPKATSVNTDTTVDTETSADNVVSNEATTETPTLNVGDTFVNTKTKDRITVVDRNETQTTVKIITPNEEVFTKVVDNAQADKAFLDSRYQKIDYTLEEPATNEAETDNESITIEAETSSAPRDINLVRYGKYYAVYGEEAKEIGANLGINTQKRTINGVSTDVLLLPADLAEELAPVVADSYNFIFSDKPSTPEVKNAPVANETVVADEETSTGGVDTAEERIYDVANAINDTLIPDVKEGILTGMNNKGVDGGLVEFAKPLIRMYRNEGTLNEIANYFTDKGEKVIAAIEGRTEVISETETTTTPTEIETTEVVESPIVPEMEIADEVVADNATPTETVADEVVNETETTEEVEVPTNTETKTYVSGNTGTKDGAIIDEIGNNSVVKAIERDKSDVATAMSGVAEQTVEMDKPVEVVYVPDGKGNGVYAAYFAQTKDSRGGQIASVNSVSGNANFNNIYDMSFVNETGFMNNDRTGTTIAKSNFEGNLEAVKQLVNNILENKGQTTFTMDDIDVNNFNDVSCALFSEVSKYLPDSIKSKLGFKSQSFGNMPRYIKLGGINSSVNTKNAVNIDHVETASGKYVDVINELFAMDDAQRESVINSIDKMPATVEELNAITENRQAESIDKTTSEVLKNEQKSDTIVEETVTEDSSAVEREDNGNERRSGILHDDGKRNDNESARKRDGKLSGVRRQNSERNESERREFARELREQGQTEQVTVGNNTFELVNPEAYNDDMLAMVEEAKNRGEEIGFFVGKGTVTIEREDGTKRQKNFDGVKTPDGKIYVQYDGRISPQTLYKHEHCHNKWRSLSMQKIKDKILGGLTEVEKKAILSTQRYQDYMTAYMDHYKGDVNKATDAVWEEFVCDVMAGMNDYVAKYSDVVNEYWNGDESVERYNPADYATETDAGGKAQKSTDLESGDSGVRYSISEEYVNEIEVWKKDGMPKGETFILGTTGDVLQGLGAIESDIYMLGDKIKDILKMHSEMSIEEIKKIPQILEKPILILKSQNVKGKGNSNTRLVIFGNVKAQDGKPILSVLDLRPTENNFIVNDMQKVSSAYTKDTNPVDFVKNSLVVYADKKRTTKLLKSIGFSAPIELQQNGYIGSISYFKRSVNIGGETFSKVFKEISNPNPTKSKDVRYSISKEQNTDYMKAVESGDMETAQKMVDEVAEKAFSDSKVRGTDGKLLKVYHGTVNDFTVFKREFANIEGDFGKGYYFTSNEYDVDANYANEEGPDLKNKIAHYAERLEWDDEYSDLSYEEREEIARQKFITSEPNTITAYLNMENPVYITPDEKGTLLDYNESYDEEYDEYGEPEGLLVDFIEALNDIAADYSYRDVDFNFLYEYAYDNGGVFASDAVKTIKHRISDELTDDNGDLALNEVIRLAFEQIGFDGIIDTSVYYKFRNMNGMDSGTTHYIVFDSEQIKSAEPVTYDDDGNIISLDDRFNKDNVDFRYSLSKEDNLKTQKRIENIAEEIGSHEEFIELAKQNTQEFVGKIKENENLQKRLDNAKRQMLKSPKPAVNVVKVGKITQEILKEVDSTLNAKDLREEITSIYNEYFAAIKSAKGVEAKVNEANDVMLDRFSKLAVDIANSAEAFTESEEYEMLKSYIKNTRIRVPDSAKADAHYAEFRKSHMGTFNLTNDGTDIDVVYEELCGLFPGKFDTSISHPADQLMEISKVLDGMKPYAYNPHLEYMNDVVEHIVNRFASEVDGLAVMPKTKAEKMAEKSAYDKEIALEKERKSFEQKLDKHKKDSEEVIRKLQKKIDDADYVRYWEGRLSKEEKAQAVNEIREKRDIAILKTQIRNIVSDMKKNLYKTEDSGGYPKELVQAAAKVLSALDFTTGKTAKDGSLTKASLNLEMLKMEYDALKNNPNYDFQTEYSEELSKKIEKLYETVRGKRVIDLTIDELSNLKDILSEIRHTLSIASRQISREGIIANNKANMEIATDIISSLKLDNKAISEVRNQLLKEMKLAKEQGKAFVINPHRIFEMIANYDKNSEWWKLYDQILRGSRDAAKFTMDATMPFDELTDGGGNEIAFFDFRTKTHKTGIKYQDGTEVELPKSIICELVMLWDRKQGRSHLAGGGIKIPDLKLFNKGKTAEALASGKITRAITQSDITRLKGMLDSYDKAWIEKSHHLFNKVAKDAINETSVQLVGRDLAKADNYIRIYVDSDFVRKDIGKEEGEITIEGHGSLKETTPDAKNPVVLRGLHENVYEHIDFASKYYGLAIPIRNFNKVYKIAINDNGNFNSVKNALGSVYGPKIRDGVVVQTIKDLQAPRPRELSFFTKVKGKWLGATFFANIRSTLKQTTSYWTAASILDEDSLAKGLVSYNKHRKQTKAEIAKYSGTLYKRAQGLSTTELGDRANRKRLAGASSKLTKLINEKAPILRKVPEWIRPGNWLQSMDVAVSSALWDACKHQVSKTMKSTDEGYMAAVRDLYERVIEETQSNYDVLHRPEVLKSTNAAWQTVGMFQTDNLQQTGIMYGAFGDLQAKRKAYKANKSSVTEQNLKDAKKRMGKAIRSRIYSSVWLAAVTALGNALLRKFKPYIDDEEKEITAQSVLEQMMLNMSEDMLSVFAPVLGQFVTKAMDTFDKDKGYDFISDPAFDVLEDFIKATSKIYYAYAEDGDVAKAWIDAIPAMSNMTGLPAKNISDLFNAVKGYIGDIVVGEFAHDLTDYTSGNKSFYNYDDLASYIVSGDKEKEQKLLDYYSANEKEISKGSLTNSVKPAYVQLYVDSPQEAYNIKRKLILDYDYTAEAIDKWTIAEYFKHAIPGRKYDDGVVSDPEYASEIANAVQTNWEDYLYSAIRSKYKSAYKKGNADDNAYLREALVNDLGISTYDIDDWEYEVEESIEKKADEQEAEKRKYE